MSFELALRLTEAMLAMTLAHQALEHMASRLPGERLLFAPRLCLGAALLAGAALGAGSLAALACLGLLAHAALVLKRYDGPYNGGSDRMTLLCLLCVTAAHWLPEPRWRELAFGYIAAQLTLSYAISGWVKLKNPEWRAGRALRDVFRFSVYPVSESLRGFADRPRLLSAMGWAVMLFELLFPLTLLDARALAAGLLIGATFHLANACLFGLNRFFWAWLVAYPSIIWLQGRLAG